MWSLFESRLALILGLIVVAGIIFVGYEFLIYIQTNNAIKEFEINLIRINN